MTANEFRTVTDFESSLIIGQEVLVRWTNSHRFLSARATLVKINAKTLVVRLLEPVGGGEGGCGGGWVVGQRIRVPRLDLASIAGSKQWSINNRVEPAGGYANAQTWPPLRIEADEEPLSLRLVNVSAARYEGYDYHWNSPCARLNQTAHWSRGSKSGSTGATTGATTQ